MAQAESEKMRRRKQEVRVLKKEEK